MRIARTALAVAVLAAPFASAAAQPKQPSPPTQRVNPTDRPIDRPPPPPPDRPYVNPPSGPAAPMQRIPSVPPPAQSPTR